MYRRVQKNRLEEHTLSQGIDPLIDTTGSVFCRTSRICLINAGSGNEEVWSTKIRSS